MPLTAAGVAAVGVLCTKNRRGWLRGVRALLLAAAGLAGAMSVTGCIGQGGLAMTPGTYTFTIDANPLSGAAASSVEIKVTINS